jgi:hypothetical protein
MRLMTSWESAPSQIAFCKRHLLDCYSPKSCSQPSSGSFAGRQNHSASLCRTADVRLHADLWRRINDGCLELHMGMSSPMFCSNRSRLLQVLWSAAMLQCKTSFDKDLLHPFLY